MIALIEHSAPGGSSGWVDGFVIRFCRVLVGAVAHLHRLHVHGSVLRVDVVARSTLGPVRRASRDKKGERAVVSNLRVHEACMHITTEEGISRGSGGPRAVARFPSSFMSLSPPGPPHPPSRSRADGMPILETEQLGTQQKR